MKRVHVRNDQWVVSLFKDEADSFMAKAIAKADKYNLIAPNGSSPYGFNHAHSHYVGMVAEHAAWLLMNEIESILGTDLKIDPVFQNPARDGECDLIVANTRIEVKGIKYGSWKRFGPCVSTRQYDNIRKKADIIVWALYNEKHQELTFKGFTDVVEIQMLKPIITGAVGRPQIENYPVLSIMHDMREMKLKTTYEAA